MENSSRIIVPPAETLACALEPLQLPPKPGALGFDVSNDCIDLGSCPVTNVVQCFRPHGRVVFDRHRRACPGRTRLQRRRTAIVPYHRARGRPRARRSHAAARCGRTPFHFCGDPLQERSAHHDTSRRRGPCLFVLASLRPVAFLRRPAAKIERPHFRCRAEPREAAFASRSAFVSPVAKVKWAVAFFSLDGRAACGAAAVGAPPESDSTGVEFRLVAFSFVWA
jgi:hypothetical protein